ncbi:hypothetical protein [Actinoplanes sp. NPDC051411]|uniref:hypothetical protein n=1 Tax=Actinoplanes sp. NPDC051411 TaxID=3155522 RepID=UPI00341D0B60
MTTHTAVMHPCRQRRLTYGWQPMQLIGRIEILAQHAGIDVPKTYELLRHLFLWEQHREPIPEPYAVLIEYALRHPNALIPERTATPQSDAEHACAR